MPADVRPARAGRHHSRLNALWFRLGRRLAVGGVAVSAIGLSAAVRQQALNRVVAALGLIRERDAARLRRMERQMPRVLVAAPPGDGAYDAALRMCVLDLAVVCRGGTTREQLALLIVHEAMHARIDQAGIPYAAARRARIERLCLRAELAFAERLPEPERAWYVSQKQEELRAPVPDYSDAVLVDRELAVFRELRAPEWFIAWARRHRLRVLARHRTAA